MTHLAARLPGLAAALLALAALLAPPARAETSPCPGNMSSYYNLKNGRSITCACPKLTGGRTVWGTMRYTIDSDVCRAAVHAGAIPASGGEVTVHLADGCPVFRANARNGVQSTNYGPYGRTYYFAADAPPCAQQTKDDLVRDCPFSMSVFAHMKPGLTWRCRCPASRMRSGGAVYGDGRYTTDSNTCLAALHAGALPPEGGDVTVYTGTGCKRFAAARRNGVASRGWNDVPISYGFASPLPACPQ
jgi:hypothetical protein